MRLAALLLVSCQHIASVAGDQPSVFFFSLDIGQVGVATFLALSGFFNKVEAKEKIIDWTKRRLLRILIPYWLVLIPLLIANWIVGYKPMTWDLVLSQVFLVTPLSHPGQLIGVHFWFISLLLTCDLLSLLIRFRKNSIYVIVVFCLMWAAYSPHWGGHAMAYFLGIACRIGIIPQRTMYLLGLTLMLSVLAAFWPRELASSVVAIATLAFGLMPLRNPQPFHRFWQWTATRSYQYYLVHGPIYLGVARFYSDDLTTIALVGTPLSLIGAELLAIVERVIFKQSKTTSLPKTLHHRST